MAQKPRPTRKKHDARSPRRWLVLSAWEPELVELRRLLSLPEGSSTIIAGPAGVGLVEAAVGATLAMASEQPDAVLFVGTAGQYKDRLASLEMDDVVAARELCLWSAEVDAGHAYFPAPLPDVVRTSDGMLRLALGEGLPLAKVACPLGISKHPGRSRRSLDAAPDVENLEAFAVGRAAARLGLPYLAILGISNLVGPSAHAQWKEHAQTAAAAACRAAWALINPSRRPLHRASRGQ